MQASAGKIMCTVFWAAGGILLIDYNAISLPIVTIARVYYAGVLRKLRVAINEKHQGKLTHVHLLLDDNAPAHRSHVGHDAVFECGFEEVRHPSYSPDPAPSNYHLSPKLKKDSVDRDFCSMTSSSLQPKSG